MKRTFFLTSIRFSLTNVLIPVMI